MPGRSVLRHQRGPVAEHAGQVVHREVPGDGDDLAERSRVLHRDVHGPVAAHGEPRDGPVRGVPHMRSLDGRDGRVRHAVHHLVAGVRGIGPLGIGVMLAVAVDAGEDERRVALLEQPVQRPGQAGSTISTQKTPITPAASSDRISRRTIRARTRSLRKETTGLPSGDDRGRS